MSRLVLLTQEDVKDIADILAMAQPPKNLPEVMTETSPALAFEIHHQTFDHPSIRIYADGRVEGLPGGYSVVVNRIPMISLKAFVASRREGVNG